MSSKPLSQCRLYTFIDTAYLQGRDIVSLAHQLCDGGSDLIQLRAKGSPLERVEAMAEMLLPVLRAAGVGLVINDHLEVAARVGAPLCHLGQEDFFDQGHTHRQELGSPGNSVLLGLSTHAPEQALRGLRAGADYLAVGPVYATPTKPSAKAVTLDYVRWAAKEIPIPWFAIGGITLKTLDAVLDVGARRICVVSAILNAPDVAKACLEFSERLRSAPL